MYTRFVTLGIVFITLFFPQVISANKKIKSLDSLNLLMHEDIDIRIFARDLPRARHMAPLGLAFYQKGSLPKRYNHSLFIAFHGSWNRSIPAGYKILRLKLDSLGKIINHEDFITGWLNKDGLTDGRPVDLELSPEGELYLSDDYFGVVYKISGDKK